MTWARCTVGELVDAGHAEVKTGPFGTQLHASDYVEEGTPVINVRNIGFGNIRPKKLEFIAEETVQRLSSHLLQTGDIVFGRKGAVERHVHIKGAQERWFQGSDCLRLRMIDQGRAMSRYLSYVFLTREHQSWMMQQCSHGATMASLNQDIIKRISLRLPPLPIQRRISSILSTYDDLIENNTRRIAVLEEMAQRLYEEWFVHLRFPGHEDVTFTETEHGRVPEGWERVELATLMDFKGGSQPPKSEWVKKAEDGYVRMVQIRDYATDSHIAYVPDTKKLRKCEPLDVMIARYGASVGRICWGLEGAYNVALVKVVPKKDRHREYLRSALSSHEIQELLIGMSGRAAQAGFNKSILNSIFMMLPQESGLVHKYDEFVSPLRRQTLNLRAKTDNFRTQHDLLLPKLVSGEIDVSEANETLEDAVA